MTAIASFLSQYPPFSGMDHTGLTHLAEQTSVVDEPAGTEIMDGFSGPPTAVFVVMTGAVDLFNTPSSVDPDQQLRAGEVFGFAALLSQTRVGPRAVAAGPARLCKIPGSVVREAFSSTTGAEFLARSLGELDQPWRRRRRAGVAGDLISEPPLRVEAWMPVSQVAELMTENDRDCVIIERPHAYGQVGIFTDHDLRSRVIGAGRDAQVPVGEVMTFPAAVVRVGTPISQVALDHFADRHAHHLPVVDETFPDGHRVRGVVAPQDFLALPVGVGVALRDQISRARSEAELISRGRRVPGVVADLIESERDAVDVSAVLADVTDAMVRRALELVLARDDELDGSEVTWMSLGSNGRREPVLGSDIDSAVAFVDDISDKRIAQYRTAFRAVNELLTDAGCWVDQNAATAANPLFSRRHRQWREVSGQWLTAPDRNKGLIMASLMLDGRPIWGDPGMPAVAQVFEDFREHPGTMRMLLAESISTRARIRSVREVISRPRAGHRRGTFDIKQHALRQVVDIARWAGLSVGSRELSTVARLRAARGAVLTAQDASVLTEAFSALQRSRLQWQVHQHGAAKQASDVIVMSELSPLDRSVISQAVHEIAGVQKRLTNLAGYTAVSNWGQATPPRGAGSVR